MQHLKKNDLYKEKFCLVMVENCVTNYLPMIEKIIDNCSLIIEKESPQSYENLAGRKLF
jgi:hypothetical protein